MKTILVTGSNGLLGQKLSDKLYNHPTIKLIATSKGENRHPFQNELNYHSLDITNEEEVNSIVALIKPDVIIHTAAMTNVDLCEKEQENCRKLNVDAVNFIAKACKTHHVYLVHLSTDFIFDGEKGMYLETDEPNPLSFYGQSKLDAENVIIAADIEYSILRTIIVYGVTAEMSRSNIVLWAKGALEKGDPINVVDDQFRSPTLAEDLADACILAAEQEPTGIFNASGKDYMSVYEMVQRIAVFFKLNTSLINRTNSSTLNQTARRPPKTGFVLDKIKATIGYNPHNFEDGLQIVSDQLIKRNSKLN